MSGGRFVKLQFIIRLLLTFRQICYIIRMYYCLLAEGNVETKRFSKNDNGFICAHCGKEVKPLGYTSRNHCPYCLWSLHVDINPGDRACECRAPMEPVKVITDPKKGYIIIHKCTGCGEIHRNKAAHEAKSQPDSLKLLISLTSSEFKI